MNRGKEDNMRNQPVTEAKFLNSRAVSEITGLAVGTLQNQRFRRTGLPYYRIGTRAVRYKLSDVLDFMEARKVCPGED